MSLEIFDGGRFRADSLSEVIPTITKTTSQSDMAAVTNDQLRLLIQRANPLAPIAKRVLEKRQGEQLEEREDSAVA